MEEQKEIVEHIENIGITAKRHSIKRDIDDILILLNKELDIDLEEQKPAIFERRLPIFVYSLCS